MPLISIPAVFDGTTIRLLEAIPFHEPYRVMVTFVEPVNATTEAPDLTRFWASFGAWHAESDEVDPMERIRADRRSKVEPPAL